MAMHSSNSNKLHASLIVTQKLTLICFLSITFLNTSQGCVSKIGKYFETPVLAQRKPLDENNNNEVLTLSNLLLEKQDLDLDEEDTELDECSTNSLCLNGGTCHSTDSSKTGTSDPYTCQCAPGYKGKHCETGTDQCSAGGTCFNGGTCEDGDGTNKNFYCLCPVGFAGPKCGCNVEDKRGSSRKQEVVTLGCGGLINIPDAGNSLILYYTANQTTDHAIGHKRQCLWAFHKAKRAKFILMRLKFTILCKGPNLKSNDDVLSVIEWKQAGDYKTVVSRILKNEYVPHRLEAGYYLNFQSNGYSHANDNGFIIRVDVMQIYVSWHLRGSHRVYPQSKGTAKYEFPHSYVDMSSILVNPQAAKTTTFTVEYVDSVGDSEPCDYHESVDIFEIGKNGVPKRLARLCGEMQASVSYTTEYSVLVLLYWGSRTSGNGVQFSWR